MVFIRSKLVKGKPYAYLVENKWVKGAARQEVKRYLGRVHHQKPRPLADLASVPANELLVALIAHETAGLPVKTSLKNVKYGNKECVIEMNGGYLCSHTLKQLRKALFERNEERPGTALAEAFSAAGLRIAPEDFVRLYKHHHP
jgi:hypothetical protein